MASHSYTAVTVTVLRILPRSVIVTCGVDSAEHVVGRSCLHAASDLALDGLGRGDLPKRMDLRVMDWLARKEGLAA